MRISDLDPYKPGAILSDDGRYRYALARPVGGPLVERPLFAGPPDALRDVPRLDTATPINALALQRHTCVFLMVNPSTADASTNDPTVVRCMGYAKAWGYWRLVVVNLFAFRSTDVRALSKEVDAVGPATDRYIVEAVAMAGLVVAAWGPRSKWRRACREDRAVQVVKLVTEWNNLAALVVTKDGSPGHPLMLPASLKPFPWRAQGTGAM